jgi:hypothetical protein
LTWLLIVFIVFVALAPLMTMMPTRQQKQLANIRQAAAVAGLQVQLHEPPGLGANKRLMACYGLRAGHRQRLTPTGSFVREGESWRNLDRRGTVLPNTAGHTFPEGVSHLVVAPDQVLAFWDEHGDTGDIDTIKSGLEALLAVCNGEGK